MWHLLVRFLKRHLSPESLGILDEYTTLYRETLKGNKAFAANITLLVDKFVEDPAVREEWLMQLAMHNGNLITESNKETESAYRWMCHVLSIKDQQVITMYESVDMIRRQVGSFYTTRDIVRAVLAARTDDRPSTIVTTLNDPMRFDAEAVEWYHSNVHDIEWLEWSYPMILEFTREHDIEFTIGMSKRDFAVVRNSGERLLRGKHLERFNRQVETYICDTYPRDT